MIYKNTFIRPTFIILLFIILSACGTKKNEQIEIRFAHHLDTQHPVHQSLLYMNEVLKRISAGSMQLVIYPSAQVGTEREVLELLQIGSMGMTKVSASSLEAFVPEMKVFSLPYLFNDHTHYWKTLESEIGKNLLDAGSPFLIKGLGYFDAGSRSFYTTKRKVETPEQLQGLKIRVMNSKTAVEMVNTMGGAATPVTWGELYTSLQQGVVGGAENNPPSFYYSKHYEVSKYYLLDEHTSIPDVIVIGTKVWDKLTVQQQQWLSQAMHEATNYQKELWAESTAMSLEKVAQAGVEIITADKTLFQASVRTIYESLNGTNLEPLVDKIKEIGE